MLSNISNNSTIAIKVENLVKKFGSLVAVNNLSFEVPKNQVLGFLGPNGAGKTTTMRMITNVLSIPNNSSVFLFGNDLHKHPKLSKKKIGIVPEISNAFGDFTVMQNIIFSAQVYGLSEKEAKKRAKLLLEEFQLTEKTNNIIKTLSKGLKQRVNFCMALIHDPELLIFDEPTSGLDPMSVRMLRKKIIDLRKEGKTVIISTHDLNEAEMVCDRIFIMNKGRIIADENPETLRMKFSKTTMIQFKIRGKFTDELENRLINELDYKKANESYSKLCKDVLPALSDLHHFAHKHALTIIDLSVVKSTLEDIFIQLIEEDNN